MRQDGVYQTPVREVTDLKQCLTDTCNGRTQSIADDAVDEWRKRLRACVKEKTFQTFAAITELELV